MALRDSTVQATQSTSILVTKPTGVVAGDVLLAWTVSDNQTNDITWPSGFNPIAGSPITTTFADMRVHVAEKVAGGSEPANYTIGSTADIIGGIVALSGRHASAYLNRISTALSNAGNTDPWTILSAAFSTPTDAICDILLIYGSDSTNGDVVHTPPGGFTPVEDVVSANAWHNGGVAILEGAAIGETGVYSVGGSMTPAGNSGWAVFAIALAEAGGGGGGQAPGDDDGWHADRAAPADGPLVTVY